MKYDLYAYPDVKSELEIALEKLFGSKLYAFAIALAVLIGHITATELYVMMVLSALASIAFFTCDSIKHFLPLMLAFVYLVNIEHSPGVPYWSDYYSSNNRVIVIALFFSLLAVSFIYYVAKKVIPKIKGMPPIFIPTVLLSVSFLMNGFGYSGYKWASLAYGAAQVVVYFVFFYAIYYGLKDEDADELVSHLIYLAALVAMVIIGEIIFMLLTYDAVFTETGAIYKDEFILGWGVSNPIGFSLGILIPLLSLGATRRKKSSLFYYVLSILCLAFAILTQSRNALIAGGVTFICCAFVGCFAGKNKNLFRVMTFLSLVGAIAAVILFRDKITILMTSIINAGLTDTGRFGLWELAFDHFKEHPIFGIGFFSFDEDTYYNAANFLPYMPHNTLMILLSSMGAVGAISYAIYRLSSFKMFLRRLTHDKLMLLATVAYLELSSLADNFVFYFYTVFLYIVVLAITQNIYDRQVNTL